MVYQDLSVFYVPANLFKMVGYIVVKKIYPVVRKFVHEKFSVSDGSGEEISHLNSMYEMAIFIPK